jgi:general L-amino acid transport system substrate-binding protein
VNVVEQVGNYQEIYERNIVPIGLTLEGSPNDLWTNGGLMYVPPFR